MPKLNEKRNSKVYLRPRFTIDLVGDNNSLLSLFAEEFKKEKTLFRGKLVDEHVFISVPKKKEHFWSPQLHLEILNEDKKILLKGLFGPKPQVWTMFMFIHFIVGISFLAFLVLLYSNISLNESIFFPVVMLVVLPFVWTLLYLLGNVGKDTGKKQIHELHNFMEEVIEKHQSL